MASHGYEWTIAALARALSCGLLGHPSLRQAKGHHYVDTFLDILGVDVQTSFSDAESPELSGRRILVANHPTGILDGLVVLHCLLPSREDVRIVASDLARAVAPGRLDELLIDVALRREGRNIAAARKIVGHLVSDGALVLFPAGTVASRGPEYRALEREGPWSRALGKMVLRYKADVTPIFISGGNSRLFYTVRDCSRRWSTVMLLRELRRKNGEKIKIKIGRSLSWQELSKCRMSQDGITEFLRSTTLALGEG